MKAVLFECYRLRNGRNSRACRGHGLVRRESPCIYLKPEAIGAAMTLTFSSPVLPGGPKAAVGSATVLRLRCCSLQGLRRT